MNPSSTIHPSAARLALRAILLSLLAAAATACQGSPAPRPDPQRAGEGRTFSFVGGEGSSARVDVSRAPDGSEALHGETIVALGASARRCVVEDVTLDARGRLARAEIKVAARCDGAPEQRLSFDAAGGVVRSTTPAGSIVRHAPTDAPWIYAPPASIVTPVAAWVVSRASALSAAVRYVDPASAHAPLVPRDQIAVSTERGVTVIVGNDGADVDASFVRRAQMIDHGITLVRVPGRADTTTCDRS
jgi:hypothetical protein